MISFNTTDNQVEQNVDDYEIQYTVYNKAGRIRYDETGGRDLALRTQPAAEAL